MSLAPPSGVRLAALLSVCLFVLCVGGYLIGPIEAEASQKSAAERLGPPYSYSYERSVWPPGIACTYRLGGGEVTVVKTFGAGAWALTALGCAVAGTVTALGATRLRSRWKQNS